jgi:hypothetical protein
LQRPAIRLSADTFCTICGVFIVFLS